MKKTAKVKASNKLNPINTLLWAGIVVLITLFTLSPVLKNEFINWDDNAYVFQNPHLEKPLPQAIQYFLGQHYFIGNYIPLTMIVYAVEYKFSGLNPGTFHLVNLLIHLLNVILVFRFSYLLSEKKINVAVLVSLLFGIHPLHVESVAWIAELKDMLYCFFFMLGLINYYNYLISKKKSLSPNKFTKKDLYSLSITLLFFLLSVLSKPAALVFPLVLLILDFYCNRKFEKSVWLEKTPFLVISTIFGFIAIKAQEADNLLRNTYSIFEKFLFASHSFCQYLFKLFAPFNLSIFYPYPVKEHGRFPLEYYLAPFLVLLLFYGIYKSLKSSRLIAFGFLFFAINVILVLQIVSVGDAIFAERYTYVSYIGPFFILAMGFDSLYYSNRLKQKSNYLILGIASLIILSLTYLSYTRSKVWKNDDTIASDLLNKFPNDWLALNNKGYILYEQGKYSESVELFKRAIQLKPDYTMAYINLINSYLSLNDINAASKANDEALKQTPQNQHLLNKKASILFSQKNYAEAVNYYKLSLNVNKQNIDNYINLSECYYWLKDYEKGLQTVNTALDLDQKNYILLNNKGYFYFLLQKYEQALPYFKEALKIKPDYTTASVNLEDTYKAMKGSLKKETD